MTDKFYYNKIKNGYTLLFSIIVASIVLSIAAFILSVSRKQFVLSSVSRDSTMAIYAADSAIQCTIGAFYNDTLDVEVDANGNPTTNSRVPCTGYTVTANFIKKSDTGYNFKYDDATKVYSYQTETPLRFGFGDACALVTVTSGIDITTNKHRIFIESRGYNNQFSMPCNEGGAYNPRTVERAIRLIYEDAVVTP